MLAVHDLRSIVADLHGRLSAIATAVISTDGHVLEALVNPGVSSDNIAILSAAIMEATAAAASGLRRAVPHRVLIEGDDSRTIVVRAGPATILVTVTDRSSDPVATLETVSKFVALLASR